MMNQMGNIPCSMAYDPFPFNKQIVPSSMIESDRIHVGIVGRISDGKGLPYLIELCRLIRKENRNIRLHIFGQKVVSKENEPLLNELQSFDGKEIVLHGFTDKSHIYKSVDIVLHLAKNEPLGRIFFESLNELKPFIGFKSGGIGELGAICGNSKYFLSPNDKNLSKTIINTINAIANDYRSACNLQKQSKQIATTTFDQKSYNQLMSQLIY